MVRVLAKGEMAAGTYVRLLDLEDAEGIHMPAGLYFVRCTAASGGTTHLKALRLR